MCWSRRGGTLIERFLAIQSLVSAQSYPGETGRHPDQRGENLVEGLPSVFRRIMSRSPL